VHVLPSTCTDVRTGGQQMKQNLLLGKCFACLIRRSEAHTHTISIDTYKHAMVCTKGRLGPAALALKVTHHLGVRHNRSQVLRCDWQCGMSPPPPKSKPRLLIANPSPFQNATSPAALLIIVCLFLTLVILACLPTVSYHCRELNWSLLNGKLFRLLIFSFLSSI
jgi:hypothetical protein